MYDYYFDKKHILVLLLMTNIENNKVYANPFVINLN